MADYSVDETITVDHAQKRTAEARRFLERIELFLSSTGWTVVAKG